ncbi:MAG: 1-acyl-sn-glycerol-3-phosphate acyltransferase [Saprospiraceae bacterium]|nr:1-acyl-sn-glycerol-3-phosphate acyltransferase [Saprospiraceae bacterium]
MTLAFRVYFRRIEVKGRYIMPDEGPVLVACNHPSSFLEGCLVSCFQDREMHYLVRGDVFNIKWLRPLLLWTNQIPIYRFRDGFSSLKKNQSTFSTTYKVLGSGEAVIIYPEGSTELVKQLRPLQKGLARLSMGTISEYPELPLKVVPVGVNYNDALHFRSSVIVSVGEALDAQKYFEDYQNDERRAFRRITKDVHEIMSNHIIHLEDPDEGFADSLLTAATHFGAKKHSGVVLENDAFERQQKVAEYLNQLTDEEKHEFANLDFSGSTTELDMSVFQDKSGLLRMIGIILIAPLALSGYILNFPAYWIARYITYEKVPHAEFKPAVRIAVWALGQMITTLVLCLALLAAGWGWRSLLPVIFPVLGIFTIWWYELYVRYKMLSRYKSRIEELEKTVAGILKEI